MSPRGPQNRDKALLIADEIVECLQFNEFTSEQMALWEDENFYRDDAGITAVYDLRGVRPAMWVE